MAEARAPERTVRIRGEAAGNEDAIGQVMRAAFRDLPHADGNEPAIVLGLRGAGALALSLVAEQAGAIVGHVAASPVWIGGSPGWYGIGPLAVLPDRQGQGIGTALIRAALARLRVQAAPGAVLTGDPDFYGRIGFAAYPGLVVPGVPGRYSSSPGMPGRYVLACSFAGAAPRGEIAFHPAFGAAPDQSPLER